MLEYLCSRCKIADDNFSRQKNIVMFRVRFKCRIITGIKHKATPGERDYLDLHMHVNPSHAEYFDVLHSSPILIQSNCRIRVISMYLQAEWKIVWILS